MLPSAHDLHYFREVAQRGNLSHAATRLGITQPSLTLAIQRLEAGIGTSLFVRSRQGVRLTKAGERLLADSRDLLQRWEQLRSDTLSTMNEVRGRFAIGCHPSVGIYTMPLFLANFLRSHQNLEVTFSHDLSRNITQAVLSLQLDIGVVVNPTKHLDLVMKPVLSDTVRLWNVCELHNPDVLICDPNLTQTASIRRQLEKQGHRFRRTVETSNLELIAHLAAAGTGVAILPTRVAQLAPKTLRPSPNSPKFEDEIFVVYRTENRHVRAIITLSQEIQRALKGKAQ